MVKAEYIIEKNFSFGKNKLKIAFVADLHERKPDDVLKIIIEEKPEIIAVAGDLFENHEFGENLDREDRSGFSRLVCMGIHFADRVAGGRNRKKHHIDKADSYDFLRRARQIAPVVMSIGNHELYFTKEDMEVIKKSKIMLLDDEYCIIDEVAYGGLTSKSVNGKLNTDFLSRFSKLPFPKILLCHHPEYYPEISHYDIDLILSGHCHGGQIRIFDKGIFSPGQGLFPKYSHGMYDNRLIVSSGCSNTASIPRWGNPTEVVIVNLFPSRERFPVNLANDRRL